MQEIEKIVRPGTLQAQAYEKIKGLLVSGQLAFDEIYSAIQFAEMLGVSRTPVREALLQLTTEGLLTAVQGRGFKIRDFSRKEIRDFFETRLMIETYVIERLVDVIREADLEALEDSLKRMEIKGAEGDLYGFLEADKAFHMSLVQRHNNQLMKTIMENIRNLISIFGRKALAGQGRTEEVIAEHRTIIDGLRCRDAEQSVRGMRVHLVTTEKYLLDNLREPWAE